MPTHILNLRATGEHQLKLLVGHYGPNSPHVRVSFNGREEQRVYVVKDDPEQVGIISIALDLQSQEVRKYNMLEITVFN